MELKKACMRLNEETVWTITYRIERDGTMTIANFDSQDNDGYMFADTLPVLQSIKEDEQRVAQTVTIDGTEYEVKNKQHVFTYKQPL